MFKYISALIFFTSSLFAQSGVPISANQVLACKSTSCRSPKEVGYIFKSHLSSNGRWERCCFNCV